MQENMKLIPVKEKPEDNEAFINNPLYREVTYMTTDFYKRVGYVPPWTGYFVQLNNAIVGSAGFKGPPVNGVIEIAYGTNEEYRKQGIGTAICALLVHLALRTDPLIKVTARTFLKENFSARILEKNNFMCTGTVHDPEDGEVWEWVLVS